MLHPCESGSLQTPTSDRKSTRLNSSHSQISYAVFCLKKKKQTTEVSSLPTQHPQTYSSTTKSTFASPQDSRYPLRSHSHLSATHYANRIPYTASILV